MDSWTARESQSFAGATDDGKPGVPSRRAKKLGRRKIFVDRGKPFMDRVRTADHAMIQPMFQVQLVPGKGGHFVVKVLKTISPGNLQPPVHPFP